jgi:hypothetical protein
MKESPKNIAASIQARLRNESMRLGKPFAETLQYFAMERFLYRLSKTRYASKFVLKGGLLFHAWNLPLRRPTKDIDFRGYIDNSHQNIVQIISAVIAEPVPEDGLKFNVDTLTIEETQIDADYQGIRVKFGGQLGRARIPMQLDIGFSDKINPKAETIDYPGLLPELKGVRLKGYPKESVISEKFHAMIYLGEINSRWKDYYDIWLISETFEFDSQSLQRAIEATFKKRKTDIPGERPLALTAEFALANRTRWLNFLKKMAMASGDIDDFVSVVEKLWNFLEYPLRSSNDKTEVTRHWLPRHGWQ